ncbi:GNAT family protein [Bacillus carboniphilus]|uniref:GNAT family protein n=1 Tax=Bacillus carboniphilus TaxID=86663 RepID=A0ABN0VRG2_9BACI
MFPTIHTERLTLREITESDASALFSYFSTDEVTRYYGSSAFQNVEEARTLIQKFKNGLEEKKVIRWGIERKEEKGLIGTIGYHALAPLHKRAEVGYEIHPDYWRNGFASEALRAVISYGFEELELIRIGAVVYLENDASNQMLQKMGFESEGILRKYMYQNGKFYDTHIYSLLKE